MILLLRYCHLGCGWQTFTDCVIKTVNERRSGVVFMLLGNFAKKKGLTFRISFFVFFLLKPFF